MGSYSCICPKGYSWNPGMGKCDGKQEIDIIQSETNAISVCNHNVKPILHYALGL